jgi:hypothetical protein
MRALAACLSLLLLGCAPVRAPVVTFALPVAADGAGAPLGPSSTREIATSVRDGAVRLQGVARLYRAVAAANVAPDGSVAGSAVVVTDVMTGKRAAMATSFYDGSFVVDVPLADGQRAVLVTLELVERGGSHRAVVGAPALLKAGEVEHDVRVNLGTTVLATLFSDMAVLKDGQQPGDQPLVVPAGGNHTFGSLIASLDPADLPKFEALFAGAPELTTPTNVADLAAGLRSYAQTLRASRSRKAL